MSAEKHEPPLALDMDFNEAMQRFAQTDVKELKEVDKRVAAKEKPLPKGKKTE